MIVEDDPPIRNFLRSSLRAQSYRTLEVDTAREALAQTASHLPDLILLDLGLPDGDGMDVIRKVREWTRTPIIVVSARGQERVKVESLDAGADDYLTKPFGAGEMLARVRVALRHAALVERSDAPTLPYCVRDLRVDFERRRVCKSDQPIHLTPTEYKLIALLAANAGKVLTHRTLLERVWGPANVGESQYLRVFMANLRRKVEENPAQPEYLVTEIGVGYRLLDE